ncbi:hypothetical protein V5O48_018463 [Marasmius crinis-equi]|uniref:Uncharacterized protein n=1 Tax=Marasmius crinis-equi TaxID=585013 RepID=A0ABR3EL45_9AGAR
MSHTANPWNDTTEHQNKSDSSFNMANMSRSTSLGSVYYGNFPTPGSPNAPLFSSTQCRMLLDVVKRMVDNSGMSENEKVNQIYWFSDDNVQDTIRNIPEFDIDLEDKTWAEA